MQQRLGKRNELQQQIAKIEQTILKQQKQIELMRILEAWKQATTYLKNKANVKYSNIPEPETARTQKGKTNKTIHRCNTTQQRKQELNNKIQINIPQNKQIKNMRKTYRDTTRKRKTY